MAHTPGPWTQHDIVYCPFEIFGALDLVDGGVRGTQICEVLTSIEDAQLIAAAPDLLKALKAVVYISDRKHEAWDAAKAAIAKATGN